MLDRLKDDSALVPGLWHLEIGNVLARAERHKRISGAQVAAHLDLLDRLPIVTDTETQRRAFREILMLARSERLTTYDAAYLELAMRRGIALATRDNALIQAARHLDVGTLPVSFLILVEFHPGIPGVSLKVGSETRDDPMLGLSDWLEQGRYPVLFSLDEAHEADPLVLGRFLNAVQLAGQQRPVGAVLAGTPGLLDTLAASRATFWSRGEKLAVGLLPDGEAHAVLARPFLDAGLDADADVVAELARAADDYPYFLQLYGAAAWDAVKATGAGEIRPEHVTAAIDATSVPRRKYYRERYEEFRKANALPLARDVALAFSEADRPMTDARLDELLARHNGDPAEMRTLLNAKGFVWQDDDDHWTPGIPSLMDYMIERTEPEL